VAIDRQKRPRSPVRTSGAACGRHLTIYSLRHASIIRSLLAGTPARLTAALHDTSLAMLERTYSAFISEFGDSVARKGLLEIAPPQPSKVVPLGRRS
jgi:hypothetical protein